MGQGGLGRRLLGPLLVVDLVVCLIVIGLSAWGLDNYIDGHHNQPHLGGNSATNYVLIYALLAGTTGAASIIVGFAHFRAWKVETMAAAEAAAVMSWALMGLAFGLAWKEIKLGGYRGKRLQTLEIFIIISTLIQLLYVMLLHAGNFNQRYGPCYSVYGQQNFGDGPSRVA